MVEEEKNTLFKKELPRDARVIKHIGPWMFFFAKSNSSFYVLTSEYHAGPLKLSRKDLSEFIDIIEKQRDELEKEIVRDLETHLASIIENEKNKEIFKGTKIKLILPE